MDKVKMTTPDGVTENIEKLAALFPAAVTEMRGEDGTLRKGIDFEKLRQLLSRDIVEGGERYEFSWVGKKAAMAEAARPTTETLRPVKADSRDWNTTENLYIEGDNLAALKILQESYLGKVKMIYIDPPYNTGNDFIYADADDFVHSQEEENKQMGMYDDEQNRMFRNTDNRGRFHSDWCSMIYSRLMLARNLLTNDGVIFVSMDEGEVANLRKIMDEVFGNSNFAGEIIWKNSSKNDQAYISIQHEYILCYVKSKSDNLGEWVEEKEGVDEIFKAFDEFKKVYGNDWKAIHKAALEWYKQFPESNPIYSSKHYSWMDEKGVYFPDNISGPHFGQYRYDVIHPVTGKPCKEPASGWRFSESTMKERIAQGLVHFGDDETTVPNNKTYLANTLNQSLTSIKYKDGRVASKKLTELMGSNCFTNPKDVDVLLTLMRAIGIGENDIVLDFFAGSGTTGEAVMQLSAKYNLDVHFILVQIQENLDYSLLKATGSSKQIITNAVSLCDKKEKPHFLSEIGKERIRRAGDKIKTEHPGADLDIGFRVFRVDSSNMRDVYYKPEEFTQTMLGEAVSNIKPDRTDLDLLYACLLDCGVPIHLPHTTTTVDGCTIHNVDNGALMACFDEHIPHSVIRAMAAEAPLQVIFRDSAFAADADKINVTEIFKNLSPDTKVRVI